MRLLMRLFIAHRDRCIQITRNIFFEAQTGVVAGKRKMAACVRGTRTINYTTVGLWEEARRIVWKELCPSNFKITWLGELAKSVGFYRLESLNLVRVWSCPCLILWSFPHWQRFPVILQLSDLNLILSTM